MANRRLSIIDTKRTAQQQMQHDLSDFMFKQSLHASSKVRNYIAQNEDHILNSIKDNLEKRKKLLTKVSETEKLDPSDISEAQSQPSVDYIESEYFCDIMHKISEMKYRKGLKAESKVASLIRGEPKRPSGALSQPQIRVSSSDKREGSLDCGLSGSEATYESQILLGMCKPSRRGTAIPRALSDENIKVISDSLKKECQLTVLPALDGEATTVPIHVIDAALYQRYQNARVNGSTEELLNRAREFGTPPNVNTIIRYRSHLVLLTKSLKYLSVPHSSVKVQWRMSQYLSAPVYFQLYFMLSRYGVVILLAKLTNNSALCVYETMTEARSAVNLHSLNQSFKMLIVSWWHPRCSSYSHEICPTCGLSESANKPLGSPWLQQVLEDPSKIQFLES